MLSKFAMVEIATCYIDPLSCHSKSAPRISQDSFSMWTAYSLNMQTFCSEKGGKNQVNQWIIIPHNLQWSRAQNSTDDKPTRRGFRLNSGFNKREIRYNCKIINAKELSRYSYMQLCFFLIGNMVITNFFFIWYFR